MYPKHYSQVEKAIQCFDKSSTSDFFKDNHSLLFLFKKTERFVAALYILTELFPDSEPLKWELRFLGTSLSREVLSFSERSSVFSKENKGDAFGTIVRAASLLEIAHVANFISVMNFSLFRKELDILSSLLESHGKTGRTMSGGASFPESFFQIAQETIGQELQGAHPSRTAHSAISARNQSMPIGEPTPLSDIPPKQPTHQQKDIISKGQLRVKDTVLYNQSYKGHFSPRYRKEERRRMISDILRTRNVATIKDFRAMIKNCSEKTVQRELLRMVVAGLLKKEGERRWSRYSLA